MGGMEEMGAFYDNCLETLYPPGKCGLFCNEHTYECMLQEVQMPQGWGGHGGWGTQGRFQDAGLLSDSRCQEGDIDHDYGTNTLFCSG